MNGVAREYWNEILDMRLPAPQPTEGRRAKQRQKQVRRVAATTSPKPSGRS